jgi:hypothetical protein
MIRYNQRFRETVQGTLKAVFQLDGDGAPRFGKDGDTTFYYIKLMLDSPRADEIVSVTYNLDESYWVPERTVTNRRNSFAEEITAYGDFLVRVEVQMAENRTFTQQALLSELLEEGHRQDRSSAIEEAIAQIRDN